MNLKNLLSIFTAIALTLSVVSVAVLAAENNDILTTEILKEAILSETIKVDVSNNDLLKPQISGEITFSNPFQIPYYSIKSGKTTPSHGIWGSAVYSYDELQAIAMLSFYNNQVVLGSILYMPDDFKAGIANDKIFSLFLVDADDKNKSGEDVGTLMYSIDENGHSKLLLHEIYGYFDIQNTLTLQTDKRDYSSISKYNSISRNMCKAVTTKYIQKEQLSNNSVIKLENVLNGNWTYKGSAKFIVKKCGVDKDGEMMYSLSPQSTPNKYIKFAGSKKIYIRCVFGGTKPIYKICSTVNSDKVIALSDKNARVQNWSESENQQWYVHLISDVVLTENV